MTEIWAGLVLGVAGSLHCAAMCGPLVLVMRRGLIAPVATAGPAPGGWRRGGAWHAAIYQGTRIASYGVLGAVAGSLGQTVAARGLGRALAVAAGFLLLAMAAGHLVAWASPATRGLTRVLGRGLTVVQRHRASHPLATTAGAGALNGLLPCGLVYAAVTAAVATGKPATATVFMIMFGLGTAPMMAVVWSFPRSPLLWGWNGRRLLTPAVIALAGLMLIGRGVALPAPSGGGHLRAHVHEGRP